MKMLKFVFGVFLLMGLPMQACLAMDLQGQAVVSVTSDTAAAAKDMAFDEARRQIIVDALRQYVDVNALGAVVKSAKRSDLMNLISASSIDDEQVSDTAYSAKISMTLETDLVRKWLVENSVQNWIPDDSNPDVFVVFVQMSNGVQDWLSLGQVAQTEKIDLGTKYMTGNSAVLELPRSVRGRFTIALREAGWKYANQDGNLKIWK